MSQILTRSMRYKSLCAVMIAVFGQMVSAHSAPALAAGRGYLGVSFGILPAAEHLGRTGVIVKKVFAGMAAEKAGLKSGEIVTQINGVSVLDPKDGVALLAE